MRALAPVLCLLLFPLQALGQTVFERREPAPASDECGRSVGFIGRPVLELESFLVGAGSPTQVALLRSQIPSLLASDPDVILIMRSGADAARQEAIALDAWVRGGGLLITEYTATQVLYEPGPLNYLDGALIDDFWWPSGTPCGGNAIRVDLPDHPMTQGLPPAWACSGDPMGTFHVFEGVDPRLCVVLSVIGSDRDGDGRDDPVLGVTRVGSGTVAPFFCDIGNFQPLEDPRACPGGPMSAECLRTVFDEIVLLNAICHSDEEADCGGECEDCDDLLETLAEANIENRGIRHALETKILHVCEKLSRGQRIPAGNGLCALLHQIDAQDGRHLPTDAAADLRACVREFSEANDLRPTLPLIGCGGGRAPGMPGGRPRP